MTHDTFPMIARVEAPPPPAPALIRRAGNLPYGYHNSFHTHATDENPPTYEEARNSCPYSNPSEHEAHDPEARLPEYSCSVYMSGIVGMLIEYREPFFEGPSDRHWQKVFAELRGTQICFHILKTSTFSSKQAPKPGKRMVTFSLQHAEVGLAVDVRPGEPVPKHTILSLAPSAVRERLQETKPHLFEPQKEWTLRLRVEGSQFLMSFDTQPLMLDWVEQICAAIDISPPIEDRTDPRYRSLPRRSRRQRQLEGLFREDVSYRADQIAEMNRRMVAQQERIFRQTYPQLAGGGVTVETFSGCPLQTTESNGFQQSRTQDQLPGQDHDMDEFDPADVLDGSATHDDGLRPDFHWSLSRDSYINAGLGSPNLSSHSKAAGRTIAQSPESILRYRRRCAPIMYKLSPRSSDVIFYQGARFRIDQKKGRLRNFEMAPPRYPKGVRKSAAFVHVSGIMAPESSDNDHGIAAPVRAATRRRSTTGLGLGLPTYSGSLARFSTGNFHMPSAPRIDEQDTDAASTHSSSGAEGGNTGSGLLGTPIEQLDTRASSMMMPLSARETTDDDISEAPTSPGFTIMPLKEKAGQLLSRRRRTSRVEEGHLNAFSGLIL